jgi:ribonucleoside-diphosphate reductase alpha chain
MTQRKAVKQNVLHELGYKIFLDRYAQKDMTRKTLAVGDTVIVVVDSKTGQREIGTVTALRLPKVTVELLDGEIVERDVEHVDKPLETDPGQMMDRVATGIAGAEKNAKLRKLWAERFRWMLDDFKFVPAGRILTGAGTDQLLTYYNCYVIPSPRDSRTGIIDTLLQMTEIMSRGGGVGINISSLRPRHAYVKGVNGRSSGAVSWGALYSFVTGLIEQGGSRRGALMLILDDWHPDVFDFINSKRQAGQITNANISVGISDKFMDAMKADADWTLMFPDTSSPDYDAHWDGDMDGWIAAGRPVVPYKTVKARDIWNAIIESAWASAEPGVFFKERYNKMSNSWYFAPIISTNPCVTGDTLVHTDQGLCRMRDLFDGEDNFSVAVDKRLGLDATFAPATRVFMTGTKPVFRLQTKEGYFVRATADHRIMTPRGWVELRDLRHGDQIHILNRKGGFGGEGSLELGRVLGWIIGDGVIKRDAVALSFFGEEKRELAPMFAAYVDDLVEPLTQRVGRSYPVGVTQVEPRDEARVMSVRLWRVAEAHGLTEKKPRVPESVFRGSEDMQRGFLQALFTADGGVQGDVEKGVTVRLAANDLELLEGVQILLSNFGITSRIYRNRRAAGFRALPDSQRQLAPYWCEAQHELIIHRQSLVRFADEINFLLPRKADDLAARLGEYKEDSCREAFVAHVDSIVPDGIEDVYDLTESQTHAFVANGIVVHNCGEQGLPAYGVCNLGAINLAKFYDADRDDVDWETLDTVTRYATRFLDNVIDSTPYFFEENKRQQLGERRVGLNNMGLAELMIRLRIRYGSDESLAFIDKLYSFMARASYETSIELAAEKGAFPKCDPDKFNQSGFMQTMPADIRDRVQQHGIRNVTLLTQAPTGCVAPDTLISTASGMQPILSLGEPNGQQWQIMTRFVQTDVGLRRTSHFYVNGRQPVKTVTTRRGFSLTATHNHRIRIIDAHGGYVWRRMDELQPGDQVVLKKDTLGDGEMVRLARVNQGSRSLSDLPAQMTPELAELLGLYMGDGYTKRRGGLHIVVSQRDPDLKDSVIALMRRVWGDRDVAVEERLGCWTLNLTGYYIPRFFEANGFRKPVGNHGEGAAGAFIPEKVLRAGRASVAAFLRGLFEADGSISRGTITLVSTSQTLVRQAQMALLSLGMVATLRVMPSSAGRYGTRTRYELRLLNRRECARFVERVGFISERKRARAAQLGAISDRDDSIAHPVLLDEFYAESKGLSNVVRQQIVGLISHGALTQQFVSQIAAAHPVLARTRLAQLVNMQVCLDEVATMADGECETYDLSVPDNHTYIANGFVSHNTTGTMVNTSTGIEPFFSWSYYRKSRLGLHEEKVPLVQEWLDAHPGVTALPDYFVTAMDLAPEDHARVQAAIQRWVDSSISKTSNLPNSYTIEQTGRFYEMLYELGCKGGTVYRDGSRSEQVLMLKGDERAENELEKRKKDDAPAAAVPLNGTIEQVATPHRVYPRPKKLTGVTVTTRTPYGMAYITMNSDEHGYPFEVFITAPGKAGSDLQADAEGMGRLISLQLRSTAPQNRMQMLKLIIDQLQGIGGARSIGMGPNRVISLPDAVAGALMEQYFPDEKMQQLALFNETFGLTAELNDPVEVALPPLANPVAHTPALPASNGNGSSEIVGYKGRADVCPSCGTVSLIRVEGCRKCTTCGYSEC